MARQRHPFFYGWVIVAAAFSVMAVQGVFFSFGVFYRPLMDHFGWSVADVALAPSIMSAVYLTSVLPISWAYGKLDIRLIILSGGILMSSGLVLSSRATGLWQLYLFYGVMAGIGNGTVWVPFTSAIMKWFRKRRGVAMGIALSGGGVGSLIISPTLAYVTASRGWQAAFLFAGLSVFIIVLSAAFVVRDSPEEAGCQAYGESSEVGRSGDAPQPPDQVIHVRDLSLQEALHRKELWLVYSLWIFSTIVRSIYTQHIILFSLELGISALLSSAALGFIGFSSIVGRLLIGAVQDRIGVRRSLILCYILTTSSSLLLMMTNDGFTLGLFVLIFGFSFGGRTTLEVPLATSLFGLAHLSIILGVFETAFGIGGFIGPYFGGLLFDWIGRYFEIFLFCSVLSILSTVITVILKPERT